MKRPNQSDQERMLAQVAALRCKAKDTILLRTILNGGGIVRLGLMYFSGVFESDFVDEIKMKTPHHHMYQVLPGLWSQETFLRDSKHDAAV